MNSTAVHDTGVQQKDKTERENRDKIGMGMESGWWRACVDPVHSLLQIIHKSRNPMLVISTQLMITHIVSLLCEILQNYITTS